MGKYDTHKAKVFRDGKGRGWMVDLGIKRYLTNDGQVVDFTTHASKFLGMVIPPAGQPQSVWFHHKIYAEQALIKYIKAQPNFQQIEESVWDMLKRKSGDKEPWVTNI